MTTKSYREVPEYFCFNITNHCNLNCSYCFANANKDKGKEPNLKEIIDILEQAQKMNISSKKVEEILIEGGEILILPFIHELFEELKKFSFKIHIISNGVLINDSFASSLSLLNCDVGVSLDGSSFEKNRFRFNDHAIYKKVLNGIKILVESGVKTYINCTITKDNADDFPELVNLASALGVNGIVVQQLHCVGNTSPDFFKKYFLTFQQELRVKDWLRSLSIRNPDIELVNSEVTFFSDIPERYAKVCDPETLYKPMKLFRCAAGIDYFCIQPNLDLIPCGAFPDFKCGNLREMNLEEAWNYSEGFNFIRGFASERVDKIDGCGVCTYNPTCDGGCRSDMFNLTGDWYAPHACCPYRNNKDDPQRVLS